MLIPAAMMPQFPSVPLEIFVDHVKEMKEAGGFPQEYRVGVPL